MICARVAGVPRPFSLMASRSSSSSTSFPAPSIADRSVASVKRAGGLVRMARTSTSRVRTFSSFSIATRLDDQIVKLPFRFGQMPRPLHRGDDREVVGNLLVVEYALVRFDPAFLEYLSRVARIARFLRHEGVKRLLHRAEIVLGQCTRIGPRIGEGLVSFVERLGERERGFGREAETAVCFALQAGQVIEKGRKLRRGLRLLGGYARLS